MNYDTNKNQVEVAGNIKKENKSDTAGILKDNYGDFNKENYRVYVNRHYESWSYQCNIDFNEYESIINDVNELKREIENMCKSIEREEIIYQNRSAIQKNEERKIVQNKAPDVERAHSDLEKSGYFEDTKSDSANSASLEYFFVLFIIYIPAILMFLLF